MTSLNPVLTLGFQIAEALIYHRALDRTQAEAETLRILERVRIPSAAQRLHEYPHQLSGGMRQRVMIAMALACKPKLLIADEPTTALDVTIQAEILELIKMLQDEEGMSVAFITHDMGVVAEIADRTVVMLNGDAVEQAPTADLFAAPREPYTRALLAAVPRLGSMKGRPRSAAFRDRRSRHRRARERSGHGVDRRGDRAPGARSRQSRDALRHPLRRAGPRAARACTRSRTSRSRCRRRDAGAGRRKRLRQVDDGPLDPAPRRAELPEPCCSKGRTCARSTAQGLRAARRRMQMIFQDPFASLNPRKTVGGAIAEPMLVHGLLDRADARERVARAAAEGRTAAGHGEPLSARILRRPAPAPVHRARARARAEAARRRRSRVGARRLDQGAGHQPDDGPAGGDGARLSLHLARHRGGRARQPSRRGDVSRRDRRDRAARRDHRESAASVHEAADRGRAGARSGPAHASARAVDDGDSEPGARRRTMCRRRACYREVGPGHVVQAFDA